MVRDAWAATGWETGRLGYPTSGGTKVTGGTRWTFQGGSISVSTATGRAVVTVR
ncbi:LGFP repeat-containing protein [Modestobacter sp. SYSU DS0875]